MRYEIDEDEIKYVRERFRPGTAVRLIRMDGEPRMPPGLTGVVRHVDDAGQIHVDWANGSSLALVPGRDEFSIAP